MIEPSVVSNPVETRPGLRGLLLAIGLLAAALTQTPAMLGQTHAGPVYTSSKPKSDSPFPQLSVVVGGLPPGQAPSRAGDFTLIEDGVSGAKGTKVRSFEETGFPLAAAVAINVSGSMAGKPIAIIRNSLVKFVGDARPEDKVAVLTIADDTIWDVPFDADHSTLKDRLQSIKTRGKLTRLYDGLLTALGGFDVNLPVRRELTVISDGHDEGSQSKLEDVVAMARSRGIAIDTIGLTRSSPEYLHSLEELAAQTGGSFHQVKSDEELQSLIENGLRNLKASPVVTFEAQHIPPDGKRHKISVRIKNSSAASTEASFVAPDKAAAPFAYYIQHLPKWGYAVAAAFLLALVTLIVLLVRGARKQPVTVATPAYNVPPPPAGGRDLRENSRTIAESLPSRASLTPPMAIPAPSFGGSPAQPAAETASPTPRASLKKTQLAGVFNASGESVARLEMIAGSMPGKSIEVTRGNFWIGAATGNDLEIPDDSTVSSRHAYLKFEDPILILVDNNSTNGTRVNGEMVRGAQLPLRPGDEVQIGRTLFRVESII